MKRFVIYIGVLSALILCLASCSKKVSDAVSTETVGTDAEVVTVVQKINAQRSSLEQVSAHLSLDLAAGKQSVKVSGDLKMKRNSIIQVTLQALGLITVGRLEFTPDYMLVMDNMNKRYVKLPYSDVPFLKDNGIDFYTFQSLFWNELFLPGGKGAVPGASAFTSELQGKNLVLKHQAKNLLLSFLTNPSSARLQQSKVVGKANRGMTCDYQGWGSVKDQSFPNKMKVDVALDKQTVIAQMEMSKLKSDDSWKGNPTKIDPKKYQELTLQQVWSAVMSLAK